MGADEKVLYNTCVRWGGPKVLYNNPVRWGGPKVPYNTPVRWGGPKVLYNTPPMWGGPKVLHNTPVRWGGPKVLYNTPMSQLCPAVMAILSIRSTQKNENFVKFHLMIIHVQFGLNQVSSCTCIWSLYLSVDTIFQSL